MKFHWNFQRGVSYKKSLPWGRYGFCMELHNRNYKFLYFFACNAKQDLGGLKDWCFSHNTLSDFKYPKFTPLGKMIGIPVCRDTNLKKIKFRETANFVSRLTLLTNKNGVKTAKMWETPGQSGRVGINVSVIYGSLHGLSIPSRGGVEIPLATS